MIRNTYENKFYKEPAKKLPSNKSFVIFFTIILTGMAIYFHSLSLVLISCIFLSFALVLLLLFWLNSGAIFALNNMWFKLGQMLGLIINPLIMAAIFFLIFTPIGFFMRFINRDELEIHVANKRSYWKKKMKFDNTQSTFKQQF